MPRIRSRSPKQNKEITSTSRSNVRRLIPLLAVLGAVLLGLRKSDASLNSFAYNSAWIFQDPQHEVPTNGGSLAILSPLHPNNVASNSCPASSFAGRGGIFVFFHLPKAGGTTVRHLFQNLTSTEVLPRVMIGIADREIRRWIADPTTRTSLMVEFHDHGNPSVPKYQGYLEDWRKMARLHDKPIFVFTIVREPVDYALSFFTYMNVRTAKHPQPEIANRYAHHDGSGRKARLTRDDFLDFSLPSTQCLFFSRGDLATTSEHRIHASKFDPLKECPEVYETMTQQMDWIGTVDTMQTELLPILTYLSDNNPNLGVSYDKRNNVHTKQTTTFRQETIANNATLQTLLPRLKGDQILYQRVQQDYRFNNFWSNCLLK